MLPSSALFGPGDATLSPAGTAALRPIADRLKAAIGQLPPDLPWTLRIDGHTDDTPVRHSHYRSNWELSAARASAVAEYLQDAGIPARRLMVAGLAATMPVAAGKDENSRRKNRRIELRLTGG